jgi:hypothetical protein
MINSPTTDVEYNLVEAMDLGGKTSLTKFFEQQGFSARHNTIQSKSRLHEITDNLRLTRSLNSDDLGVLYYHALKDDIARFEKPLTKTIQDSTILLRSLAWYSSINHSIARDFESLIEIHPKFNKAVVLTANIETRTKRLQMRIDLEPEQVAEDDLLVIKDPELFTKMDKNLIHYATQYFGAYLIDTSNLSKAEVVKITCKHFLL